MTVVSRKRGDTYADEWIIRSKATGQPKDISGFTFLMTLNKFKNPQSDEPFIYQLVGVVSAEVGKVSFAPTPEQADRLGSFFYDIQMIDSAGKKRTIELNRYLYNQDVSK